MQLLVPTDVRRALRHKDGFSRSALSAQNSSLNINSYVNTHSLLTAISR